VRRNRIWASFTCVCAAGLAVAPAEGQTRGARVSRPSEQSPSLRAGRVGGAFTQGAAVSSSRSSSADRSATSFNLPGSSTRFGVSSGSLGPLLIPQAFQEAPVGYSPTRSAAPFLRSMRLGSAEAAGISGLDRALRLSVPWRGGLAPILPERRGAYYPDLAGRTEFDRFFGIQASPRPAGGPASFESFADLMERETESALAQRKQEAVELFREATSDDPLAAEKMSRAVSLLKGLHTMQPDDDEVCLLLVHAALQKEQPIYAAQVALDLASNHPQVLAEKPDLKARFGDPGVFNVQMRVHLHFGDEAASPQTLLLQAYCAWALQDRTRLTDVVGQIRTLNRGPLADPRIDAAATAFLASLAPSG